MVEASYSNEFHQRRVRPLVEHNEPDCEEDERYDQDGTVDRQTETDYSCHSSLENDDTDNHAVADYWPSLAGRVSAVVHGVKKLIFIDEAANDEIQ